MDKARLEEEAKNDGNLKWKGPYVFDMLLGTVSPELPSISLVDGSYEKIEFRLMPARGTSTKDGMLNASFYLEGTVNISGVTRKFVITNTEEDKIKLKGTGAVEVAPTETNLLAVAFDPSSWFNNIDFSQATLDSSGSIVIDKETNASLLEGIRKNVRRKIGFGKDDDGDGKINKAKIKGDGSEGAVEVEKEG